MKVEAGITATTETGLSPPPVVVEGNALVAALSACSESITWDSNLAIRAP
jgi:hypothetical protein